MDNKFAHLIDNLDGSFHAGKHVLLDLYFCNSEYLKDPLKISEFLKEAAIKSGATILFDHFHTFGDGCGVTGMLVLSESHISIHSWPEIGFASIDLYMCGDANPEIGAHLLIQQFESKESNLNVIKRGNSIIKYLQD